MKGACQPAPTASEIASESCRAALDGESSSTPGEPVSKARAGAESSSSGTTIAAVAKAGRRRADEAAAATRERPEPGRERPIWPALMRGPSRVSRAGSAAQAIRTAIAVTTARAAASETSREPGWKKAERKIEKKRVAPAIAVVRPALRRVIAAAAVGGAAGGELLAEAGDDQQRVVDAEGEAHHRADDQREGVDRHQRGEEDEDAAAGEDGDRAEGERDQRRRATERKTSRRTMSRSGAASSSARSAAASDSCCRAREMVAKPDWVASHRRVDVGVEGVFEPRDRVAHRLGEGDVVVEQEQGARAAGRRRAGRRRGQLAGGRGRVPGRDHGERRVAAQGGGEAAALALDRAGGAAEQDGERRGVAEALRGRASSPRAEGVPAIASEVGRRWSSTPRPIRPRAATTRPGSRRASRQRASASPLGQASAWRWLPLRHGRSGHRARPSPYLVLSSAKTFFIGPAIKAENDREGKRSFLKVEASGETSQPWPVELQQGAKPAPLAIVSGEQGAWRAGGRRIALRC